MEDNPLNPRYDASEAYDTAAREILDGKRPRPEDSADEEAAQLRAMLEAAWKGHAEILAKRGHLPPPFGALTLIPSELQDPDASHAFFVLVTIRGVLECLRVGTREQIALAAIAFCNASRGVFFNARQRQIPRGKTGGRSVKVKARYEAGARTYKDMKKKGKEINQKTFYHALLANYREDISQHQSNRLFTELVKLYK